VGGRGAVVDVDLDGDDGPVGTGPRRGDAGRDFAEAARQLLEGETGCQRTGAAPLQAGRAATLRRRADQFGLRRVHLTGVGVQRLHLQVVPVRVRCAANANRSPSDRSH